VADGAAVSSPVSGRLTDHIAIGVLSGLIHRDIVDDVINECRKREKRSRLLPAHVVVYYVLALNLTVLIQRHHDDEEVTDGAGNEAGRHPGIGGSFPAASPAQLPPREQQR
jgi:hypothetical protein